MKTKNIIISELATKEDFDKLIGEKWETFVTNVNKYSYKKKIFTTREKSIEIVNEVYLQVLNKINQCKIYKTQLEGYFGMATYNQVLRNIEVQNKVRRRGDFNVDDLEDVDPILINDETMLHDEIDSDEETTKFIIKIFDWIGLNFDDIELFIFEQYFMRKLRISDIKVRFNIPTKLIKSTKATIVTKLKNKFNIDELYKHRPSDY
jgi:hypothetical protein